MVEQRPVTTYISHLILILGIALVAFPIWVTFVAASHDAVRMTQVPLPLLPGDHFFENLRDALTRGVGNAREQSHERSEKSGRFHHRRPRRCFQ